MQYRKVRQNHRYSNLSCKLIKDKLFATSRHAFAIICDTLDINPAWNTRDLSVQWRHFTAKNLEKAGWLLANLQGNV